MNEKAWADVDDYIGEQLLADADPSSSRCCGPTPPAGCRRSMCRRRRASSSTCWCGSAGPGGSSRSARSAAIRPSGWPRRCRPAGRLITLEFAPKHAEVAQGQSGAGRAAATGSRSGSGAALDTLPKLAERAVRPDLHRRRQAEQCQLPDWALKLSRAGHGDHPRQCRPRRRGDRRQARPTPTSTGARGAFDLLQAPSAIEFDRAPDGRRQGLGRLHSRASSKQPEALGLAGAGRPCEIAVQRILDAGTHRL